MNVIDKVNQKRFENKLFQVFGSKSDYRSRHPHDLIIFNSYVLTKDEDGLLQKVQSFGDLNLSNPETIETIKKICLECECNLRIYKESTVHNETFNGYIFPYDSWTAYFEFHKPSKAVDFILNPNF